MEVFVLVGVLDATWVGVKLAVTVPASTAKVGVVVGLDWVVVAVDVKGVARFVDEGVSKAACCVRVAVGVAVNVGGNPGTRVLVWISVKPDGVGVNKKTPVTTNSVPTILPSSRWISSNAVGFMGAFFS